MKKNNKNLKQSLLALALVLGVTVSGISAYFTATDTAINNFNVKKVDVQLDEPNYIDNQDVTPNETIEKDPTVTNIGTANQFVFLSVKVPYKNIITANADGTRNEAADTELFFYTVNEGWTEIGIPSKGEIDEATGIGYVEHIYAYGTAETMTVLEPEAVTKDSLFDSVTMASVVEGQGLEETEVEIDINVYAIQDSDLGTSGAGTVKPEEVLAIYLNQNQ